MQPKHLLPAFACTMLLLGGCGSSSGGDSPAPLPAALPPGAFAASLTFDAVSQRFEATWGTSARADRYRALLRRTSADAPQVLNDSIPLSTPAYNFIAGLNVEWTSATLRIEACNSAGCTAAPELPLLPHRAAAIAEKSYQKSALARAQEFFGFSVATSNDGNTLAIGLPKSDASALQTDTGSVEVFVQAGATWLLQSTLTAPNMRSGDQFGFAVSLSGDGNTLAVSAPYEAGDRFSTADAPNTAAARAGAVYVFNRDSAGAWDRRAAYLKASNAEGAAPGQADNGDQFGLALDLSTDGNTIVVGAWNEDGDVNSRTAPLPGNVDTSNNGAADSGAAYVFVRGGGANSWAQQAYLKASNAGAGDQFGAAVTLSSDGNVVAVGAFHEDGAIGDDGSPNNDHNGAEETGAAYVFARNGAVWSQQGYLKAARGAPLDWFGWNLALSAKGDLLAVGAPFEMRHDGLKGGVVHVYSRAGNGAWTLQSDVESTEAFSGAALFGHAMAFDAAGKSLVVSAVGADVTRGQAYLFTRAGQNWQQQSTFVAGNPDVGDQFGVSIAYAGDGRRLFVGAAGESGDASSTAANPNNAAQAAGAVYVY